MIDFVRRWRERRITRAWVRETQGDRELLEQYYDYEEDPEAGVTTMTPKPGGDYLTRGPLRAGSRPTSPAPWRCPATQEHDADEGEHA